MRSSKGFTIVELLIVIVVIAILAAIVIVAFNGVQTRARDNIRKQDLAQIAKTLKLYETDRGNYATTGCGAGGSGNGWYGHDYDGATTTLKSSSRCLVDAGYMGGEVSDPTETILCSVGTNCHAYIKYHCGNTVYLYANLETQPHTPTDTDGTCAASYDTDYGMNYVLRVN